MIHFSTLPKQDDVQRVANVINDHLTGGPGDRRAQQDVTRVSPDVDKNHDTPVTPGGAGMIPGATLKDHGIHVMVEDGRLTLTCPLELSLHCKRRRVCEWRLVFDYDHACLRFVNSYERLVNPRYVPRVARSSHSERSEESLFGSSSGTSKQKERSFSADTPGRQDDTLADPGHPTHGYCGYRSDDLVAILGIERDLLTFPGLQAIRATHPEYGTDAWEFEGNEAIARAERIKAEREIDIVQLHRDVQDLKRKMLYE